MIFLVTLILFISSCTQSNNEDLIKFVPKNIPNHVDLKVNQDTLFITTNSKFLYYPFGSYNSISSFPISNSEKYEISTEKSEGIILYKSSLNSSFIKYFISKETYPDENFVQIISARIVDTGVLFVNGYEIGITKLDVLEWYFREFDKGICDNINIIVFESGLVGIWHYYYFFNNKLIKIMLDSDYQFNKS